MSADARYFASPAAFRAWLEAHHDTATELWVGFYKVGSGKPSLTWPQAVDEALCFGWIDGVRKRVDDQRYVIRFTPRKRGSIWSEVNVQRAEVLSAQGRMHPAGLQAFAARDETKTAQYSYEARTRGLDPAAEARFRENARAWAFFSAQAPSYRRAASWWVVSARREDTRLKRLATLIAESEHGRRLAPLSRPQQT